MFPAVTAGSVSEQRHFCPVYPQAIWRSPDSDSSTALPANLSLAGFPPG